MHNRRKFLFQGTLAAGSLVLLKPFKTLSLAPATTAKYAGKINILNVANCGKIEDRSLAGSLSIFSSAFEKRFLIEKQNSMLLATGTVVNANTGSTTDHIEKLAALKKAGCEAIVPGYADIETGIDYYHQIITRSELTSLVQVDPDPGNLLPYHIVLKGDIKVGIIGNTIQANGSAGSDIQQIASQLNNTAYFLKSTQQCHLIVSMNPYVCSDATKNKEKEIAALTKNIDLIVSSNNNFKYATTYIVKNAVKHEVILNYQGCENTTIKSLTIDFNNRMEKTNLSVKRVG